MIPADPGGSASSIFSPIPAETRFLANLPMSPPAAAPTAVAARSGGAKRPTDQADAAADLDAFAAQVVTRLLDVDLALGVLVTRTTPSLATSFSSTSFTSASKSCLARSGIR